MYDNLEDIKIKKIKLLALIPILILLALIVPPIASILLAIGILMLLLFIVIAPATLLFVLSLFAFNYIMLAINKRIIKNRLKPIIKEAQEIYKIDIVDFEHLVYYKNNSFVSVKIPIRFKNISNAIKNFKERTGSLDNDCLPRNITKADTIANIKKETGNIFFSNIQSNSHIKNNIHLYDLKDLDCNEFESLYKSDLSIEQKYLISKKYCLDEI